MNKSQENLLQTALQKINLEKKIWSQIDPMNKAIHLGQLIYIPVPFYGEGDRIVETTKTLIAHGKIDLKYSIRDIDLQKDFKPSNARLNTRGNAINPTEEIITTKAKLRPCVVLGFVNGVNNRVNYYVAPVYSCFPEQSNTFDALTTLKAKCFQYPNLFYLEADASRDALNHNSILRLDKAFWTELKFSVSPILVKIKSEVLSILRNKINELHGDGSDKGPAAYLKIKTAMQEKFENQYVRPYADLATPSDQ